MSTWCEHKGLPRPRKVEEQKFRIDHSNIDAVVTEHAARATGSATGANTKETKGTKGTNETKGSNETNATTRASLLNSVQSELQVAQSVNALVTQSMGGGGAVATSFASQVRR